MENVKKTPKMEDFADFCPTLNIKMEIQIFASADSEPDPDSCFKLWHMVTGFCVKIYENCDRLINRYIPR